MILNLNDKLIHCKVKLKKNNKKIFSNYFIMLALN